MAQSIVIIIASIIGSAFISASEAALIAVNKFRMRHLAAAGDKRAVAIMRIGEEHEKFFGAILLSGNVLNILATAVATSLAITLMGNSGGVVAGATALTAVVVVVFAELTPKSLATSFAERWSLLAARPVLGLMIAAGPFVWIFAAIPRVIAQLLGGQKALMAPSVTEGELRMLIELGELEGTVASVQGERLENIFRFGETEVREVMTPRNELVLVEAGTTVREFMKLYRNTRHTRFPVYEDDPDDIVGILSIKDVLYSLSEHPEQLDRPVTGLMRTPLFVPESKRLDELFAVLRQGGHKIALVVDEYGGIAGLVTLTRILEQVVGRTGEEGLTPAPQFSMLDENTYELEGGMSIDEANDRLDLHLPEGEFQTIAGFILEQLQHIPEEGERFRFNDMRFMITKMDGNRLMRVQVRRRLPVSDSVAG